MFSKLLTGKAWLRFMIAFMTLMLVSDGGEPETLPTSGKPPSDFIIIITNKKLVSNLKLVGW